MNGATETTLRVSPFWVGSLDAAKAPCREKEDLIGIVLRTDKNWIEPPTALRRKESRRTRTVQIESTCG